MRRALALGLALLVLLMSGCTRRPAAEQAEAVTPPPAEEAIPESTEEISEEEEEAAMETLTMRIGETQVTVDWEENESVDALRQIVRSGPLVIQMSMYGGFEQVGSIGQRLPRRDAQTVTESGDIVLYSGDQLVVFYGSNSWAYTRLGHITDKTPEEMRALLGSRDVVITLSVE